MFPFFLNGEGGAGSIHFTVVKKFAKYYCSSFPLKTKYFVNLYNDLNHLTDRMVREMTCGKTED